MFRVLQKSRLRDWWKGDRSKLVKNFTNLIRVLEECQSLNLFMSHMRSHQTTGKGALKSDGITRSMNMSVYAQLCPILCNLMDCSPPSSFVHGIFQARLLEYVAFPPPGDLPNPGIELESPVSLTLQADSLPTEPSIKSSLEHTPFHFFPSIFLW